MQISASALVLLLFCSIETTQAWPNGAGGCILDGVSVSNSHLSNMPLTNASLADAGFELVINVGEGETILKAGGAPVGLTLDGVYTFTVRATGDATFKGALMRFSEELGEMDPAEYEDKAKPAFDVCGPYPGLTHLDASEKTNFTGMMSFETAGQANLLVDLVIYNSRGNGSSYAFSTYPFSVTGDDDAEDDDAMAPTRKPVAAPVSTAVFGAPSTSAPVQAPVARTPGAVPETQVLTPAPLSDNNTSVIVTSVIVTVVVVVVVAAAIGLGIYFCCIYCKQKKQGRADENGGRSNEAAPATQQPGDAPVDQRNVMLPPQPVSDDIPIVALMSASAAALTYKDQTRSHKLENVPVATAVPIDP